MYGLNAISTYNGWAISVVGVTIVFTGLVLLSLAISQIHKFLDLWENRKDFSISRKKAPVTAAPLVVLTPKQKAAARQYKLLSETLEAHFSLPRLLQLAVISGIDTPHAHLAMLLEREIIVPDHQGHYTWNMERHNALIS